MATRMRTFRNRVAYSILSRLGRRRADAAVKAAWAELSERSFLRSRKRFERALLQGRLVRKLEPRQLRHSWILWLRRSRRVRATFVAWKSLGQRAGRLVALSRARADVMRLARTRSAFGRWSVDTRAHTVARRHRGLYICLQNLSVRRRTIQLRMLVHGVSTWRTFCQRELTKGRGLQAGAMARGALALCHLLHLERLSLSKSWLRWRAMTALKIKMQAVAIHRFRLLLPRSRHRIMVSIDARAQLRRPHPHLHPHTCPRPSTATGTVFVLLGVSCEGRNAASMWGAEVRVFYLESLRSPDGQAASLCRIDPPLPSLPRRRPSDANQVARVDTSRRPEAGT